jgi:ABC-type branched-subunit amino acid transport system ATPase component
MSRLSVKNIKKSFGANHAVKDVSFELDSNEMLALIGPNGAGKSTTFNLLSGQMAPDGGQIEFEGQSIVDLSDREIAQRGVGRTFQIAQTFGSMTLLENVQVALLSAKSELLSFWHPAKRYKLDEAMELLRRVGLELVAHKPCCELSYGDVKRLELAVALANEPKLLLMDEPTAGMAPSERHQLMALIHQLVLERQSTDNPMAVLFTEHSMDVIFGYAQRVLVLAGGQLIAEGSPQQVRDNELVQSVYFGGGKTFKEVAS